MKSLTQLFGRTNQSSRSPSGRHRRQSLVAEALENRYCMSADLVAGLIPEITVGAERDEYEFAAVAGDHYTVETSLGSLADTTLAIYAPNGEWIAFNDDGGDGLASRIDFVPEESGNYRVEVAAYSRYQTGTYRLSISGDCGVSVLPIPLPKPKISVGGESDEYLFVAEAGIAFTIATALGTLSDTTLTLLSPSGLQIAFDDDGGDGRASRIEFTASESGLYRIRVSAYSGYQTGTYALTLAGATDDNGGPLMSLNGQYVDTVMGDGLGEDDIFNDLTPV